jgi:hypothetical protein
VTLKAAAEAPSADVTARVVATSGSLRAEHPFRLIVLREGTAPVVESVRERLVVPSTVTTSGVDVSTQWTASDAEGNLSSFNVNERRNAGSWTNVATTSGTSRSARLPFVTSFQHRVRGTDTAGNIGAYLEGPETVLTSYSENTSLSTWSSGWTSATSSYALGGGLKHASTAGASVTLRFEGRGVGWIARTSSSSGNADVFIDDVLVDTVNLEGSSRYGRLVFARDLEAGPHTMRIVVLGTSGRPRIDIDGFIVER